MTCEQVRECLFAFLDNELDAPLSIEIQRHIEHCPHCAREVEIERGIRRGLAEVLTEDIADHECDEESLTTAIRRLNDAPPRSVPRRRFASSWAVAACTVLLLGGYTVWHYAKSGSERSVADLLVTDFEHFLEKGKPIQLASSEPGTASDWLREATGLQVFLPAIDPTLGQLVGARKCKLAGQPAAFALYELDGTPASLIIMPGEGINLDAMQRVHDGPHVHWLERKKGHTVLACRRGELVYAAVSTLREDRLALLMTSVNPRE